VVNSGGPTRNWRNSPTDWPTGYLEQDIQPGDHIGLYLQNCVEYVEATLAAYKVRAVPININYRYTAGELQHLFDDADLVGVVHQWGFTNRLAEVAPVGAENLIRSCEQDERIEAGIARLAFVT